MLTNEKLLECIAAGKSYSQIAGEFGTSRGAVSGRASRLKKVLNFKVPHKHSGGRPKKINPAPTYSPETRVVVRTSPRTSQNQRYFRPATAQMSKSEMRSMLKQAVENTR